MNLLVFNVVSMAVADYIVEGELSEGLPSVGGGLEEESDVSGRDVQSTHADDESDQTDEDRADNVPELEGVS